MNIKMTLKLKNLILQTGVKFQVEVPGCIFGEFVRGSKEKQLNFKFNVANKELKCSKKNCCHN